MSLALTDWRILLTDLNSVPVAEISDDAIAPSLTQELNGIDRGEFTLNLESQAAYVCEPMKTLVKIWRDVPGYTPFPYGIPQVVGVVNSRVRNAAARTVTFGWASPFWRLTFRYHIDAHDFTWETGRGIAGIDSENPSIPHGGTDPTEIMWRLIDWTNNLVLYTQGDRTGIRVFSPAARADYTGADPSVLINDRTSVGQNTWDYIQKLVMPAGMPDLNPTYIHVEGSPELVWFNTTVKKGEVKSFSFDYRTGQKNLDDIVDRVQVEPGGYSNYVVVQGQGDRSTGWYNPITGESGADQTIVRADGTSQPSIDLGLPDLISEYGLYMHFERDPNQLSVVGRKKYGMGLLARLAYPPVAYELTPSSAITWAWPYEFQVGDTVTVSCDRDSMQVSGVPLRITEVTIARTPNKMETLSLTVVDPDTYKVYPE